jgi:hypothetical protein
VVGRRGQLVEEPPETAEVGGVECGDTRAELAADAVQAISVSRREDQLGPLGASKPGRFESDARAAADHDDGLSGEIGPAAHAAASAVHRFWYG